jgi:DNA-directed RNA polymerase subunit K/omega
MAKYIVNPIEVRMIESEKRSIYQSIVAMGVRSRQINADIKREIVDQMEDIVPTADDNETANADQVLISKKFESMPKPSFISMKEIFEGDLDYTLPKEEEEEL